MKKIIIFLLIILALTAAFFFFFSKNTNKDGSIQQSNKQIQTNNPETKVGDTQKIGTVVSSGGRYLLETDSETLEIDSYGYDLAEYLGQKVQITGQYSGDTLFVGNIE